MKNFKFMKALKIMILTLIVSALVIKLYMGVFGPVVKVELLTKYTVDNTFVVSYTTEDVKVYNSEMATSITVPRSEGFKNIPFKLGSKRIKGLKVHFGGTGQDIEVKKLVVKTPFKKLVFKPEDIKSNFKEVSKEIETLKVEDEVLKMHPRGQDAYISADTMGEVIANSKPDYNVILYISLLILTITVSIIKFYQFINRKNLSLSKVIFIMSFIFVLNAPNLFLLSGMKDAENTEKRGTLNIDQNDNLEGLNKKIRKVEALYDDNFGLRNLLIKANSFIDVKLFNSSPTNKVVIGKEGWLFYGVEGEKSSMDLYRGTSKFTEAELSKIKNNLEERRDWLKNQGIPFILLITPNKETIYPEYYNDRYKKVSEESRQDQLLKYLRKNSNIDVVDLRESLKAEKKREILYLKTDTHWNELGAYFGYKGLTEEIHKYIPTIKPLELDKFDIKKEHREAQGGDLANMLSLSKSYGDEYVLVNHKDGKKAIPNMQPKYGLMNGYVLENPNKSLPKLLMFRDSFTINMIPYISEHFSESVYEWTHYFHANAVKEVKPDIVIHQIVERNLDQLLIDNPEEVKSVHKDKK